MTWYIAGVILATAVAVVTFGVILDRRYQYLEKEAGYMFPDFTRTEPKRKRPSYKYPYNHRQQTHPPPNTQSIKE